MLSGNSIIHSGHVLRLSVVTASSLVGIDYVISVNNIPSWLLPGEGDGCGRQGGIYQVGWSIREGHCSCVENIRYTQLHTIQLSDLL